MKTLAPKSGFLGLSAGEAKAANGKPKATVIPFGLESSVTYGGGAAKGPRSIIKASSQVELFDEDLWLEPFLAFSLSTLAPFPITKGTKPALDQLERIVEDHLAKGCFPLVLGGEHSLTAGAIRPFARRHRRLAILHFDAHADLRDGYEGEPYSHAAAMRRCLDNPNVTIISVGVRNLSAGEADFLEQNRHRVRVYWAKDRRSWDANEIASHLAGLPVYLSFDVDAFDASLMPATGTPEPGGLFWDDVLPIIRAASKKASILGADICELAPIKGFHACEFAAAKLAYKILAFRFAG